MSLLSHLRTWVLFVLITLWMEFRKLRISAHSKLFDVAHLYSLDFVGMTVVLHVFCLYKKCTVATSLSKRRCYNEILYLYQYSTDGMYIYYVSLVMHNNHLTNDFVFTLNKKQVLSESLVRLCLYRRPAATQTFESRTWSWGLLYVVNTALPHDTDTVQEWDYSRKHSWGLCIFLINNLIITLNIIWIGFYWVNTNITRKIINKKIRAKTIKRNQIGLFNLVGFHYIFK